MAPQDVLKIAFATNQGDTSRITDTQDGSIFAVRVDKITPPEIRPFDEVKDAVVSNWQAEQKEQKAQKEAEALAAAARSAGSLAKAAGDKGLTLFAGQSLTRTPQQNQTAPPPLVAKLFTAKQGDVVTVSGPTGAYAAQLKEVQIPEAVPDDAAKALAGQLTNAQKLDLAGEFTEALRRRFPVEVKREALDRMF